MASQFLTYNEMQVVGSFAEYRFMSAMRAPSSDAPYWFRGLRSATHEEDQGGVDAVAFLDTGEVPIQVKSSMRGLKKDCDRYKNEHCIIIVSQSMDIDEIRQKTFHFLYRWRGRILNPRQRRH